MLIQNEIKGQLKFGKGDMGQCTQTQRKVALLSVHRLSVRNDQVLIAITALLLVSIIYGFNNAIPIISMR